MATGGGLASLLESFRPAAEYFDDIAQAAKIISLVEQVPDSVEGLGWAFDVLAVGVRILGIGYLANEGRYVFGFREILDGLTAINRISEDDRYMLAQLRCIKSAYRSRRWKQIPSSERLFEIMAAVRRLGIDVGCAIRTRGAISDAAGLKLGEVGYPALRAAERHYWTLTVPPPADLEEFSFLKGRLAQALFRPQDYLGPVKSSGERFQRIISRMERIAL